MRKWCSISTYFACYNNPKLTSEGRLSVFPSCCPVCWCSLITRESTVCIETSRIFVDKMTSLSFLARSPVPCRFEAARGHEGRPSRLRLRERLQGRLRVRTVVHSRGRLVRTHARNVEACVREVEVAAVNDVVCARELKRAYGEVKRARIYIYSAI
jgi:hypothetical protein